MRLFSNDREGLFIARPNRFIVTAQTSGGIIRAHCPNPGRLQEILIPGRRLIFSKSTNPKRKTPFTLEAAYYEEKVIPLYAAKANRIARELFLPRLFPEADTILAEQKQGNSRFDFLIQHGGEKTFLEVKACSLVEEARAMFPDAPTERGLRHIKELSHLAKASLSTHGYVLFVIMNPNVEVFSPNIHTDQEFSLALRDVSEDITIKAVSILCSPEGEVSVKKFHVPVDLSPVQYVMENTGAYLILIKLDTNKSISVGRRGVIPFKKGFYIYTGSAKKTLSQRIKRHLSKKKKHFHWHIDYLTAEADTLTPFPVYTGKNIECDMADDLKDIADRAVPGFGSSDCSCGSHLFYFKTNPAVTDAFQQLLHHYWHNP